MTEPASVRIRTSIEEVRQTELIDATIRTITRLGFDRTTIRDIARTAGASTGSVHYYFANKDELLRAAVVHCDERFRARMRDALADVPSALGKLERLFALCFPDDPEAGQDYYVFIDFWQQAARRPDFRHLFDKANAGWLDELTQVIGDGAQAGELVLAGTAREEAMGLAAMIDGLALYARVTYQLNPQTARRILRARVEELRAPRSVVEISR
jgi:AcrR family transcriptional regulator